MSRHTDPTRPPLVSPAVRRRAYPVALALIALAVAYGLIDGEQTAAWTNLAAAALGAGVAALGTAYRPGTGSDR
nr:hypothetical protein [Actinomyces sp.]